VQILARSLACCLTGASSTSVPILFRYGKSPSTREPPGQPVNPAKSLEPHGYSYHPTVSADGKRLVVLQGDTGVASGLGAVVFVADLEDKRKASQQRPEANPRAVVTTHSRLDPG
jgi:hypothetical protein